MLCVGNASKGLSGSKACFMLTCEGGHKCPVTERQKFEVEVLLNRL